MIFMEKNNLSNQTDRRRFLGSITAGSCYYRFSFLKIFAATAEVQDADAGYTGHSTDDADRIGSKKVKGKQSRLYLTRTEPNMM